MSSRYDRAFVISRSERESEHDTLVENKWLLNIVIQNCSLDSLSKKKKKTGIRRQLWEKSVKCNSSSTSFSLSLFAGVRKSLFSLWRGKLKIDLNLKRGESGDARLRYRIYLAAIRDLYLFFSLSLSLSVGVFRISLRYFFLLHFLSSQKQIEISPESFLANIYNLHTFFFNCRTRMLATIRAITV